jgi:hypothetical protein
MPLGDARVVGVVETCWPFASCVPARKGSVLVVDVHGVPVAEQRVVRGRFAFSLVPGRYTVRPDTRNRLPISPVTAVAHRTKTVNINFNIP